jgi:endonuclease V-like protein UPF0215 family
MDGDKQMATRRFSHVVGFDDAPFTRSQRGNVLVVGAVFAGLRPDGVLSTRVRRDGQNATLRLAACVNESRFAPQLDLILLQGIAFAGFNVVDIHRLQALTNLPVLVVARGLPNLDAIRSALLNRVPGGARKWRLIERAGPMQPVAGLYTQHAGLTPAESARVITRLQLHGKLPEPIRLAHLIAGGVITGESRHRA